ncbi:MAG: DNA recombination protein RmuC, partial [Acidimicrobiia bacterium]|nr:DNA recombination protein RmuC [Acidimicrobiia bacterium]
MSRRRLSMTLLGLLVVVFGSLAGNLIAGNEPSLGLDLQGGVSVTQEPVGEFNTESLDLAVERIRERVDSLGVAEPEIIRQGNAIVVNLPGGRQIPIDAKVPLSAYFDSLEADRPEGERAARRADHAQALRNHVRTLGSRAYAKALGADIDLTVLFVPVESAVMAALETDPALFGEALDAGVFIATPGTLLVLLRTCALHWQQAALAENAQRIGERAKELLDRIERFAEHL